MSRNIRIKRGLDIPLEGAALGRTVFISPSLVGIVPDDFEGHTWKCAVKEGDAVAVGSPLLFDKVTSRIKVVSPLAGKVREIRRGERRKILAVVVESAPASTTADSMAAPDAPDAPASPQYDLTLSPDAVRAALLESGLWAFMRQRPFDIVPEPEAIPRDVFVTTFDSSPLAPRLFDADADSVRFAEKGLEVLACLSGKKPYVASPASSPYEFRNAENLVVDGPHPAGNVGPQIAAVAPVNKGETVFTLDITTVVRIGRLYLEGAPSWTADVALTGPEMPSPHMVRTLVGASLAEILPPSLLSDSKVRVISGNVLTGHKVDPTSGFLHFPYRQVTAIREGDDADEFMGWASMSPNKYSTKRTFPAFLKGLAKPFPFDARIKGGRRAMILSGEFDKVFPFDIYPEYLLRAINAGDIERMEKLGIYEVAPEDFALPEFVDTSKHELQPMVRSALDTLRSES